MVIRPCVVATLVWLFGGPTAWVCLYRICKARDLEAFWYYTDMFAPGWVRWVADRLYPKQVFDSNDVPF